MGVVEWEYTGPSIRQWEELEREKRERGERESGQKTVKEPDDPGEDEEGLGDTFSGLPRQEGPGHGGMGGIHGRLGSIRHRWDIVEFRVDQHLAILLGRSGAESFLEHLPCERG